MMKRFLLALVLACALSAPAWAGFDEGLAAFDRGDYETALRELRPLAEQGNAKAQINLGLMYEFGFGVPQDHAEALKWYRRAVEQGDAEAKVNLGVMYERGDGVPQDYAEALKWHRRAAEQGLVFAQVFMGDLYYGDLYYRGYEVVQDYAEVVKWRLGAAQQGHVISQLDLGRMYKNGQGVVQDYVQAHMWFNIVASKQTLPSLHEVAVNERESVEKRMTPAQVSEAQRLAREWKPKVEAEN